MSNKPGTNRKDGLPPKGNHTPEQRRKMSIAASKRGVRQMHPRTPEQIEKWQTAFIDALRKYKNVSKASEVVGYSARQAYRARKKDKAFAEAWDEAWESVVDDLEASAMERAINGFDQPVFHQGSVCGSKVQYDPILTIFMLKKNRPAKYDDRLQINVTAEEYAAQVRNAIDQQDDIAKQVLKGEKPFELPPGEQNGQSD